MPELHSAVQLSASPQEMMQPPLQLRSHVLAGLQLVRIHGQTHGAAGGSPLEARVDKYLRQALGFSLRFDGVPFFEGHIDLACL